MEAMLENAGRIAIEFGLSLVGALATLVAGLWVIRHLVAAFRRVMERRGVDPSLHSFLGNLVSWGLKALLLVTVVSMVGVEATSFVAILAAAGFAVGMALSGSLSNFAGGVLILLLRPFRVGDFVEAQGFSGTVREIQVFHTVLNTGDNKTVILPNGPLSNGSITNFSTEPRRRIDLTFGIGYGDDIARAREVIAGLLAEDARVARDPAPLVRVASLGDSSVNLLARFWVGGADYWEVLWGTQEKVKLAFDREGISIPFPQRDVHLHPAAG